MVIAAVGSPSDGCRGNRVLIEYASHSTHADTMSVKHDQKNPLEHFFVEPRPTTLRLAPRTLSRLP